MPAFRDMAIFVLTITTTTTTQPITLPLAHAHGVIKLSRNKTNCFFHLHFVILMYHCYVHNNYVCEEHKRSKPGQPLSHLCPGPCDSFRCKCQISRWYPPATSNPDKHHAVDHFFWIDSFATESHSYSFRRSTQGSTLTRGRRRNKKRLCHLLSDHHKLLQKISVIEIKDAVCIFNNYFSIFLY